MAAYFDSGVFYALSDVRIALGGLQGAAKGELIQIAIALLSQLNKVKHK